MLQETFSTKEFFDSTTARADEMVDIGEIAAHIGMTPQSLHWYEAQGIISPQKVNCYRKYTSTELCLLSRARFYRQIGFSVTQIDELLDMDISSIAASLDEHALDMKWQLEIGQIKLSIVEEKAELARSFSRRAGRLERVQLEPFFFKHSYKRADGDTDGTQSTAKFWASDVPITQYIAIAEIAPDNQKAPDRIGLALPQRYLPYASKEVVEEIERGGIPLIVGQPALYGLFSLGAADTPRTSDYLRQTFDDRYTDLEGVLIMRPICCRRFEDSVISYWEAWFPLKQ
ncbi:MAG: MerR family transcriptional regulator [Coriobacteriales bacterium]|jgi:DNA-binding transcriptional MerR regulator|nr:MerR family transcriptional regulator [Coriobacteriales bacterium]